MLQLCKSSNKCLPYRTSVQYLDTSAAQAAVCFLTGMLHCFIAVIQTPKSECTPCCMQSGQLLPVLRNSQCGVYEGTHEFKKKVWNILSQLFFENKFLSYSLTSLSASSPYCKTQPHWQLDHGPCQTVRLQVFFRRFEELDNQSWMNLSATTLKVQNLSEQTIYNQKFMCNCTVNSSG